MRLLLWSLVPFSLTIADSVLDDTSPLIFSGEAQSFGNDFPWDTLDVALGPIADDSSQGVLSDNSVGSFDESSSINSLNPNYELFAPEMDEETMSLFNLESDCSMTGGSTEGKVRRQSRCEVKDKVEEQNIPSESPPSSQGSDQTAPTSENDDVNQSDKAKAEPLSSSLIGVSFSDLCPQDKVPGKVPLCCADAPYGRFVGRCTECKSAPS